LGAAEETPPAVAQLVQPGSDLTNYAIARDDYDRVLHRRRARAIDHTRALIAVTVSAARRSVGKAVGMGRDLPEHYFRRRK